MLWIYIISEVHASEHWILKWVRFFFCSLKCFFFTIKICHRGKMKIQQTDFCNPVWMTVKSSWWKLQTGVCLCLNDLQVLSVNNTSSGNSETKTLPRSNDRYWDVSCLSSHLILKIKSFLSCSTVTKKPPTLSIIYPAVPSVINIKDSVCQSYEEIQPLWKRQCLKPYEYIQNKPVFYLAYSLKKVNTGVDNGWSKKSTYLVQKTPTEPKRKLGTKTNERTNKCTQKC